MVKFISYLRKWEGNTNTQTCSGSHFMHDAHVYLNAFLSLCICDTVVALCQSQQWTNPTGNIVVHLPNPTITLQAYYRDHLIICIISNIFKYWFDKEKFTIDHISTIIIMVRTKKGSHREFHQKKHEKKSFKIIINSFNEKHPQQYV